MYIVWAGGGDASPYPPWIRPCHQSSCMPQLQPLCSATLVPNVLPGGMKARVVHECVGDWVATESSVSLDGQSRRASFSAKDTRWSCIPCGSGSSMEQPTVTCHIIIIVGVIQTQSQDRAVPEIVRLSLISADAPRQLFDFVTCPWSQHWFTWR